MAGQELALSEYESSGNKDVEMNMWHTKRDMIRNESIHDKVGMDSVVDKMKEARMRWF